jgi:hypothetical protein
VNLTRTTHHFKAEGRCPINGQLDRYEVRITLVTDTYGTKDVVAVEDIRTESDRLLAEPIFQEDYTRSLAAVFVANVVTRCHHAGGFFTVCEAQG